MYNVWDINAIELLKLVTVFLPWHTWLELGNVFPVFILVTSVHFRVCVISRIFKSVSSAPLYLSQFVAFRVGSFVFSHILKSFIYDYKKSGF